jgi:hypothetical protein
MCTEIKNTLVITKTNITSVYLGLHAFCNMQSAYFLSYFNWWPAGVSRFSKEHKTRETVLPLSLSLGLGLYEFFNMQNL